MNRAQNPFKTITIFVIYILCLEAVVIRDSHALAMENASETKSYAVQLETGLKKNHESSAVRSNDLNDLVSGKSFGLFYVNDCGEPHGGFEFCGAYYAILELEDSKGVLTFDFLIGIGDPLQKHEYAVELKKYSPDKMELLIEGETLLLEWIEHDTVWNEWHRYYIASDGTEIAPEQEWIGMINPEMFPGLVSTFYVELRLPWITFYSKMTSDVDTLSASSGGVIHFELNAGPSNANRDYFLLGSASPDEPGTLLPGGNNRLSLCWDLLTDLIVPNMNSAFFSDFMGTLDSQGLAEAQLNTGALPVQLIGHKLAFAFLCNHPFDAVSNPVAVKIVL